MVATPGPASADAKKIPFLESAGEYHVKSCYPTVNDDKCRCVVLDLGQYSSQDHANDPLDDESEASFSPVN